MKEYYLFTFESTHSAIKAQKLLSGLNAVTMPTLREISASCGISLKVLPEQIAAAKTCMEEQGEGWSLYHIFQSGKEIRCELIQ